MKLNIKAVGNGLILTLKGQQFVFTSETLLGNFLFEQAENEKNPPVPVTYDLIMTKFPADKQITAIRLVRELTRLGLKDSKDLTDAVKISGGAAVLKGVTEQEALDGMKFFDSSNAGILTVARPSRRN